MVKEKQCYSSSVFFFNPCILFFPHFTSRPLCFSPIGPPAAILSGITSQNQFLWKTFHFASTLCCKTCVQKLLRYADNLLFYTPWKDHLDKYCWKDLWTGLWKINWLWNVSTIPQEMLYKTAMKLGNAVSHPSQQTRRVWTVCLSGWPFSSEPLSPSTGSWGAGVSGGALAVCGDDWDERQHRNPGHGSCGLHHQLCWLSAPWKQGKYTTKLNNLKSITENLH